jgi:hypothetical protein
MQGVLYNPKADPQSPFFSKSNRTNKYRGFSFHGQSAIVGIGVPLELADY